jgi:hypothetical protein
MPAHTQSAKPNAQIAGIGKKLFHFISLDSSRAARSGTGSPILNPG